MNCTNLHQLKEIFTRVKHHLLTQGVQSVTQSPTGVKNRCLYRGPNGTKCAIGCLISDDQYLIGLEGKPAGRRAITMSIENSLEIDIDARAIMLLARLQDLHDTTKPESWEDGLKFIWRCTLEFVN